MAGTRSNVHGSLSTSRAHERLGKGAGTGAGRSGQDVPRHNTHAGTRATYRQQHGQRLEDGYTLFRRARHAQCCELLEQRPVKADDGWHVDVELGLRGSTFVASTGASGTACSARGAHATRGAGCACRTGSAAGACALTTALAAAGCRQCCRSSSASGVGSVAGSSCQYRLGERWGLGAPRRELADDVAGEQHVIDGAFQLLAHEPHLPQGGARHRRGAHLAAGRPQEAQFTQTQDVGQHGGHVGGEHRTPVRVHAQEHAAGLDQRPEQGEHGIRPASDRARAHQPGPLRRWRRHCAANHISEQRSYGVELELHCSHPVAVGTVGVDARARAGPLGRREQQHRQSRRDAP